MRRIRIVSLALLLLFTAAFASCQGVGSAQVFVGKTSVDDEVFLYYLNQAIGEGKDKTKSDSIIEAATAVRYYVKVNTAAAVRGITLSAADKAALSEKLNRFWAVYGTYYMSIGVTKQTVEKVNLSEAYETSILLKIYGQGGTKEVARSDILTELNKSFVVFRSVRKAFATADADGNVSELTAAEKELLVSRFVTATGQINNGSLTLEAAAADFNPNPAGSEPELFAVRQGTPLFSEDFFNKAVKAPQGKASVIQADGAVYLIQREKVTTDSGYFRENSVYAFQRLKGEELKTLISGENAYEVEFSDNKAAEFYDRIIKARQ